MPKPGRCSAGCIRTRSGSASAAQALERAVRLDASDVAALTALANAYVGLGRIERWPMRRSRARSGRTTAAFEARCRTPRVLRHFPPSRESPRGGGSANAARRGDRSCASSGQGSAAGARAASGRPGADRRRMKRFRRLASSISRRQAGIAVQASELSDPGETSDRNDAGRRRCARLRPRRLDGHLLHEWREESVTSPLGA